MCVVSMRVRHEQSNEEVIKFAKLDSSCQGTLDLGGIHMSEKIKRLTGQSKLPSQFLDNLTVSMTCVSKMYNATIDLIKKGDMS